MLVQKKHEPPDGDRYGRRSYVGLDVQDLPGLSESPAAVPEENRVYWDAETGAAKNSSIKSRPSWYGDIKCVEDAMRLFRDGWEEGFRKTSGMGSGMGDAIESPRSIRRKRAWGEEGDDISVERALAGEWDVAWSRTVRQMTSQTGIVTVGLALGGNCDKSAEELFWCGAQSAVLSDLLEDAGYQVELHAIFASGFSWGKGHVDVLVKKPDQPLRTDQLVALVANAGVFRTLWFGAICHHAWAVGFGLGHAQSMTPEDLRERVTLFGQEPLDLMLPEAFTREQAVLNLVAAIRHLQRPGEETADPGEAMVKAEQAPPAPYSWDRGDDEPYKPPTPRRRRRRRSY